MSISLGGAWRGPTRATPGRPGLLCGAGPSISTKYLRRTTEYPKHVLYSVYPCLLQVPCRTTHLWTYAVRSVGR